MDRIIVNEEMAIPNLYACWFGILFGFMAGAIEGLFFDKEDWLGGYASWPRRMLRLAHISFFGIALINFIFALSISEMRLESYPVVSSILLIAGAILMPLVCCLSAIQFRFRYLFPLPVFCLVIGWIAFLSYILIK